MTFPHVNLLLIDMGKKFIVSEISGNELFQEIVLTETKEEHNPGE